jgi:hypothetical protein
MAEQYTHKMVDGAMVPLTPEEIAELEARDAAWAADEPNRLARQQRNDEIANDAERIDMIDRLQNATNAQINTWVDNAIDPTTLPQMRDQTRAMFKRILKLLANLAPPG